MTSPQTDCVDLHCVPAHADQTWNEERHDDKKTKTLHYFFSYSAYVTLPVPYQHEYELVVRVDTV